MTSSKSIAVNGSTATVIISNDPRLHVMISSTTVDLPEHRHETSEAIQRMGHTPVMMEHGSAEWNSDAIKFSLEKVGKSQVYIGIFGLRYGYIPDDPVRNPDRLSITEMEYRHAQSLKIPILIYIAAKSHPFEEDQIDFEPEKREKLKRIKDELTKGIVAFFDDAVDLRSKVLQSLHELKIEVDPSAPATSARPNFTLPEPPALYAVPDYTLTNSFVGRRSELAKLDEWAKSSDAIMVVEGIGGLGKSALTWEWVKEHSAKSIPSYAGGIWWSFYEKGTSMVTFVRHALAYVLGVDPESLIKDISHYQRGQQLLVELRKRPFLLVLDGFERVLTAYHRLDKAQLPDDQVDQLDLRECVNPADGELLMQLLRCGPSKILISTRLFPTELQDRASHKPIPGVAHHHLNGLSPLDALALVRQAGVTGSEQEILKFADQFGRHSLLLRIVCGMIADYRKKPLDFDAWRADPIYGGSLKLTEIDLKPRYTHILKFALDGLEELTRRLLSRIAVISENATYETLLVLNPFMPPRPQNVEEPDDPSEDLFWEDMSEEDQQEARSRYCELQAQHSAYQNALKDYLASPAYRVAMTSFDTALKELEDRGLLQWDRDSNRYNMHPVVRAYAAESLEAGDRAATFNKVRDHFAALPPDDLNTATELAHITQTLEIYRCLVGAGKLDDAASFYEGVLDLTLLFHLGAYPLVLELLRPLFRNDLTGLPCLKSELDQSEILTSLANAYVGIGRNEEAIAEHGRALQIEVGLQHWTRGAVQLLNLLTPYMKLNRRAANMGTMVLIRGLTEAADDEDGHTMVILNQMSYALEQGCFDDGEALYAAFRKRPEPPTNYYRPGDAEFWHCMLSYYQGKLTEADWQAGFDLTLQHRNVLTQYPFLALRAEWDLGAARPERALEAIDQAIQITNKLGTPSPDYHDLRAWALAALNCPDDARIELQSGEQRLFAAEAHRLLGDLDQARVCALNAYRRAWGEGPPHILWFYLERSRKLLQELGEPEPQLPPFDPSKVEPIPFEKEIREAIAKLNAEKAAKADQNRNSEDNSDSGFDLQRPN